MDPHTTYPAPGSPADAAGTRTTPPTILLVEDQREVLTTVCRRLRSARPQWQLLTATTIEAAEALLSSEPVDVLVCDLQLADADVAELLERARVRFPYTARIGLSDHRDLAAAVVTVGPAQQFLPKPYDVHELLAALDRVLTARTLVTEPRLRALLGTVIALPQAPFTHRQLLDATADRTRTLEELTSILRTDLAACTDVLRLVNAVAGTPVRVDTIGTAVHALGRQTIRTLALLRAGYTPPQPAPLGLDLSAFTAHAHQVATMARAIARADHWPPKLIADAYTAGLLHQVALPVLAAGAEPAATRHAPTAPAEHVHADLARASAYLIGLWGFPRLVVRAVANQDAHPDDPRASLLGLLLSYTRQTASGHDSTPDAVPTTDRNPGQWRSWQAGRRVTSG